MAHKTDNGPMNDNPAWAGWSLQVPGISYLLSDMSHYEYKLPYSVPTSTFCARLHPKLYCCDVYFCQCLNKKEALPALSFVDVVDQDSGHQVRHRQVKACCRVPSIVTFMDGQEVGNVSRTMRCGNRCLTCMEDFAGSPVEQVGLHDEDGKTLARINRNGRGKCFSCSLDFPMKKHGCCFTAAICSLKLKPSVPTPCFGLMDCDPVCWDQCVLGPSTQPALCQCEDVPLLCIGCNPCCSCCCSCPCIGCDTKNFESVTTIMLKEFEVVDGGSDQQVGKMQAQFRGNYPSAYTHAPHTAFKVNGNTTTGKLGVLLSAVAAGMVFPMGALAPALAHITANPNGTSPDFTGWVQCKNSDQVKQLVGIDTEPLMNASNVVMQDLVFGGLDTHVEGVNAKGYMLTEFGYQRGGVSFGPFKVGGFKKDPRSVSTREEVKTLVNEALEFQLGKTGTQFNLRFILPDLEKQIVKKGPNVFGDIEGVSKKFNPGSGGFVDQMEEVNCVIDCVRVWACPCNFNQRRGRCCSCPLYARVVESAKVAPAAWAEPPPSIVMVGVPKTPYGKESS